MRNSSLSSLWKLQELSVRVILIVEPTCHKLKRGEQFC